MLMVLAIAIASLLGPHDVDARSFAQHELEPFLTQLRDLRRDLADANDERRAWPSYSDSWRSWSRTDANGATDGYTRREYQWSVAMTRQSRDEVTKGRAVARLERYATRHADRIAHVVITDARGGAVIMIGDEGDWFQGDEPAFTDAARRDGFHLSAVVVEDDARTQMVSVPIRNSADTLLGVAIVTVRLDTAHHATNER